MTTFGLVHGAWHGGWCWKFLVAELDERGHRSIAPDMPIDDATAGLAEYAAVVIDALDEADDVVLVGHSMGSLVIPLVACARPTRGMVFLCSVPVVPDTVVGPELAGMVTGEAATAVRFVDDSGRDVYENPTARRLFVHDCDDDIAAWAVANLRPQGPRPLTEASPLTAWPDVASQVILTDDDRVVSHSWSVGAARAFLGHEPTVIPGSHSPFLSHPDLLADALVEVSRTFE
jgi:pimeloyl-ACP methyl ester carboxylesterase